MPELILCGSGGWVPTRARETCCALVRRDEHALLIDAGTGVSRLVEEPDLLRGVTRLDVVLTHFHLDHVTGIGYLPALDLPEPPTIHAPGRWLYGTASRDIVGTLCSPPFLHVRPATVMRDVREYDDRGLDVGPFRLAARRQERHSGPTAALRIDDEFVYCTDTALDADNARFARGARVLLHEAWYAGPSQRDDSHSSARDAAWVADAAEVASLVLIHIHPHGDEAALLADASARFPGTAMGQDLRTH